MEVLDSVRDIVSGSNSSAQFAAEINYLSKCQREEPLKQVQLPLVTPADHALAMKADLAISWSN